MNEGQLRGMQHLAWRDVAGQLRQALVLPVAVGCIPNQRVAEKLEVHPNLVRAASVEDGLGQGRFTQSFEHAITGPCLAPGFLIYRHAFAMRRMPRNGAKGAVTT